MPTPITNHPRGTRGAFVEYSLGPPPLIVPFQFNPLQLQRSRSLGFDVAGATSLDAKAGKLSGEQVRKLHQAQANLLNLQAEQQVTVQEESLSLEIRLDATDGIDEGNAVAARFGIAPQIAILEQMVTPREGTLLGKVLKKVAGISKRFSYTSGPNPPLILFVWGSRWVLPVNINTMTITESEFNLALYPLRATVAVTLTVIEGVNAPFKASLRAREALAAVGMASVVNVTDVIIPG